MLKPWKTKGHVRLRNGELSLIPVSIEINWSGIADEMARRAYANKSGRAVVLGGLLRAKVTKTRFTKPGKAG